MFTRFAPLCGALMLLTGATMPALATDAACIDRFESLVADGTGDTGPVRIHAFQEVGGSKTENYFFSPGSGTGDGLMQPIANMGDMWVLFRNKKMYVSTDAGGNWQFVRDMDDASQPESYKAQVLQDLNSADQIACGQDTIDGVAHDTVEGQYPSTALQGAVTFQKYWIRQDTGFVARNETRSDGPGGPFYALQILEPAPGLELPNPD